MNLTDEEAKALIVIRELGAITNADYRQMNHVDTLTASQSLRKFRDHGLIYQKGTASKTYYIPTKKLIDNTAPQIAPFSKELLEQLKGVQRKMSSSALKAIIKNLCATQPQKLADLAVLLKRNPKHLREHYLTPMLKSHELELVYPDKTHPMQAYKLKDNAV